jgi:hypothetical protein
MQTLKCFKRIKSLIELEEVFLVLLPDKETLAMMMEIVDCQVKILLLNLAVFLANQIALIKLTKAEEMTTLH